MLAGLIKRRAFKSYRYLPKEVTVKLNTIVPQLLTIYPFINTLWLCGSLSRGNYVLESTPEYIKNKLDKHHISDIDLATPDITKPHYNLLPGVDLLPLTEGCKENLILIYKNINYE